MNDGTSTHNTVKNPGRNLIKIGCLFGLVYILLQMIEVTHDQITTVILKVLPVLLFGYSMLLSYFESKGEEEEDGGGGGDRWKLSFSLAFVLYGLGDLFMALPGMFVRYHLPSDESVERLLFLFGLLSFGLGHILVIIVLNIKRKKDDDDDDDDDAPKISIGLFFIYLIFAMILIYLIGMGNHDVATTVVVSIYSLLLIATMFFTMNIYLQNRENVGYLLLTIGTHLFLVSDLIIGLNMLFSREISPILYYPIVMGTYYVSLVLETIGIIIS